MADPAIARTALPPAVPPAAPGETGVTRALAKAKWQGGPWDSLGRLSSVQRTIEQFLMARPFERGPWLAVGYAAGIAAWAVLSGPWQWAAILALCAAAVAGAVPLARDGRFDHLAQAIIAMALVLAAGLGTIWMKSALVGSPPIAAPATVMIGARIIDRLDDGAVTRLMLAARTAGFAKGQAKGQAGGQAGGADRAMLVEVLLPHPLDQPGLLPGAIFTARARLAPPPPPMLPGAHDFAFVDWFRGLSATGAIAGPITVIAPGHAPWRLGDLRAALRDHVLGHLHGSPGAIAVTLVTGEHGAMDRADAQAMRDAGFAHLLAIGGLHVGAVIGAVYWLVFRALALLPWLALRVRVPLVAALAGALAGLGYALITGGQVPTIRAGFVAIAVLGALALGRDPLSMRLLAGAALLVMLVWPESVMGASFQMSFVAVMVVIALRSAEAVQAYARHRDEGRAMRLLRHATMLLIGGLAIEFALMPVALLHFHRAGIYGAWANLLAIPLVTLVAMPALALALLLDLVGAGAPAWWITGKALGWVLAIARDTAAMPGAVTAMPTIPGWAYALWLAGLLWLALWSGRVRLWGLGPMALALGGFALVPVPDILIAGDGKHIGITGAGPDLVVLSPGPGRFARDTLLEAAGMTGSTIPLEAWPGARCTHDFCALALTRSGRRTVVMISRSHRRLDEAGLAQACAQTDLVIADRALPESCRPRQLRIDAPLLARTGGMTIDLANGTVRTVAETGGQHVWGW